MLSASFTIKILEKINFPKSKRETVLDSIKYHDPSFPTEKCKTTESKVLFDADKFDSFGAIAIYMFLVFKSMRG
jgi:hypothetical protein